MASDREVSELTGALKEFTRQIRTLQRSVEHLNVEIVRVQKLFIQYKLDTEKANAAIRPAAEG